MKRTLIIAAHQDDESLSCAGLILRRIREGSHVTVLVLSGRVYNYGATSEEDCMDEQTDHFIRAMKVLKVGDYTCVGLREGEPQINGYYKVLETIERTLRFGYTEVVVPSATDLNQDHRHYAEVCQIALRSSNLKGVKRILEMQAFDSTAEHCNYYVPLNEHELAIKLKAVAAYTSERRTDNHPRSPRNIRAHHMLAGSKVGVPLAEPYKLLLLNEGG
jgi:LmbE family N-acetylglucosaminyl deacetylase